MGLHARVVPAPPKVVALLVVRRRAEPGGSHRSVVERLEDHEALLEVGLVVVGALEGGAPVVHGVEEHVVQDDPAALADDPTVVDDPRVASLDLVVAFRGRSCGTAGHAAAQQQRRDESGVDEPRRPGQRERGDLGRRTADVPDDPASDAVRGRSGAAGRIEGTGPRRAADRRPPPTRRDRVRPPGSSRAPRAGSVRSGGRTPRRMSPRPSERTTRRR